MKYSWRERNNSFLMALNFAQNSYLEIQTVPQTTGNLLTLRFRNNYGVILEKNYIVQHEKMILIMEGETIYSKNKNRYHCQDTFLMLQIDSFLNHIFWYSILADS